MKDKPRTKAQLLDHIAALETSLSDIEGDYRDNLVEYKELKQRNVAQKQMVERLGDKSKTVRDAIHMRLKVTHNTDTIPNTTWVEGELKEEPVIEDIRFLRYLHDTLTG